MENFRLKVFRSVAKNLSFTKAANELFITQPAVTKNIKALESEYGLRFFSRKGNRIYLTAEGIVLFEHVDKLYGLEQKLEDDLNSFKENPSGILRLGASTTIAQYVIPSVLSKFHKDYPDVKLSLRTGNTEQIAESLLKGEMDLGIVEGRIKNKDIHYIKFLPDELVAVVRAKNKLTYKNEITLKELIVMPMVLRERGSGTLDVIEHALKSKNVKLSELKIAMHLGSTEAIKLFLEYYDSVGFIPMRAIEKELKLGTLKIIKIKNLKIKRTFDFITPQGLEPTKVAAKFIITAKHTYNQK
jgi:LysR family transcriptional regulator, transcriptional activator of the cysJI operon